MESLASGKVRVLCLGNELVRDDGVGLRIGRVLRSLRLPDRVTVELRRAVGLELLDELDPSEAIVLVDAARTGAPPGTCTVRDAAAAAGLAGDPTSCHGVGIAEVLRVAEALQPGRPRPRITVVAVEAEDLSGWGLGLSAAVRDALPGAVSAVLVALGASEQTLREGRRAAERWKDWQPSLMDVVGGEE
jgi:hydrogenase maturation protease